MPIPRPDKAYLTLGRQLPKLWHRFIGGILMRSLVVAALALSLSATSLFAADTAAPLAPGKAAGVKTAQASDNSTWFWVLGSAAAIGIIVAVSQGGGTSAVAPNGTALTTS